MLNAQNYNPFIYSAPKGFTEADFKNATIALIEGKESAFKWHKGAREGLMAAMIDIFGVESKNYKAIIEASKLQPLTSLADCQVARLHVSNGTMGYRVRMNPYPGEQALFINDIPWISAYCGNPIKKNVVKNPFEGFSQQELVHEDDSAYERTGDRSTQYVDGRPIIVNVENTLPQQVIYQPPVQTVREVVREVNSGPSQYEVQYMYASLEKLEENNEIARAQLKAQKTGNWVNGIGHGLNFGVGLYSAIKQDRYQNENRNMFSWLQNQMMRKQQQPRRNPRHRNDWPNDQNNDPDFQGLGEKYFTSGPTNTGQIWSNQFTSTGTFVGTNTNTGAMMSGASVPPFTYMAQGFGPNGTHFFEDGFKPANYGNTGTTGNWPTTNFQEIGFKGTGTNTGGNTNTGGTHHQENGYNNGNW